MKLIKSFFWLAVMIVPFAGMIGCTAGGVAGFGFPQESVNYGDSGRVKTERVAQEPRLRMHDSSVAVVQHESNDQVAPQLPSHQPERVSFVQSIISETLTQPATALVTLGPNESLRKLVENASGIVLVDFYADWCGPCRTQGGILHEMESLARQNGALIIKVNVDEHQDLAQEFQVSSLPTLLLIRNGQVINRQIGMADQQRIASMLQQ